MKPRDPGHRRRGGHPRLAADDPRVRRLRSASRPPPARKASRSSSARRRTWCSSTSRCRAWTASRCCRGSAHLTDTTPIVVMSGHATITTAVEATRLGAFDFIEKPLESERVLVTVRNAVDSRAPAHREPHAGRDAEKRVPDRRRVAGAGRGHASAIQKAAPTNATVLIWGESGVGKELVARAIHRESLRRDERVRAGELRRDSRRADRVGAVRPREGVVHRRHRPADRQVRAGRQGHDLPRRGRRHEPRRRRPRCCACCRKAELERLGSNRIIKVDVRVIAATNKDLEEEIDTGTFREDLFYRLERRADPRAAAARAARGHPGARAPLRGALRARQQLPPQDVHGGGDGAAASSSTGAATSASCATSSSG